MNNQALISFNILAPCDCQMCCQIDNFTSEPLVYRILNSKFRIRTLVGRTTIWIGCPRDIDAVPSFFEEVFDQVGDDSKMILIYHLNYFRSNE